MRELDGGLGIRDLQRMNDALILKLVWAFVSQEDQYWIQVMKAKYCSSGSIWEVTEITRAMSLWRKMVELREFFNSNLRWIIRDGAHIPVHGQPWHELWNLQYPESRQVRTITVVNLRKDEGGCDQQLLIAEFGQGITNEINRTIPPPVRGDLLPDMLIWTAQKSGVYTVKEGYKLLSNTSLSTEDPVRKIVWKDITVIPKVRMFLWRACHNGLATAAVMHQRIQV
jgi:zinc-binding in reverse transcriptase